MPISDWRVDNPYVTTTITTTTTLLLLLAECVCVAEPVPISDRRVDNPYAIERPHAPADLLYRQCSYRGFDKLTVASGSSPFKRHLSLPPAAVVTSQQRAQHSESVVVICSSSSCCCCCCCCSCCNLSIIIRKGSA